MQDFLDINDHLLASTVEITIAAVSNPSNRFDATEIGSLIMATHVALSAVARDADAQVAPTVDEKVSAAQIKASMKGGDKLISFLDGKPYSTLKRHLTHHGLTPEQYRDRFGLPATYPMVAPNYAEKRRFLAKATGLGHHRNRAAAA